MNYKLCEILEQGTLLVKKSVKSYENTNKLHI